MVSHYSSWRRAQEEHFGPAAGCQVPAYPASRQKLINTTVNRMRAEAHAPRAVPEEGLECASGAGGALAARPAAGLPGAAAVEEGGGRLHNR